MTTDDFEIISVYTREQAIDDGMLVETGTALIPTTKGIATVSVCLTTNCFVSALLDDEARRAQVMKRALAALLEHDHEDTPYMRLRVLNGNLPTGCPTLWVILDHDGITVMLPEDY
ncbi:MAG: hypothetical protein WC931_02245 [Bacilli bacterium]|jgi:hypothetical protein